LIYAFGHQHLGLTLSAVTGELVGDLALGRTPSIDLSPFDIARFERGWRQPKGVAAVG
jgi:D-amino-acid dehydrogenase